MVWESVAARSLQQKQQEGLRASKEKNPTAFANPAARRSQVVGSSLGFNSFPRGSSGTAQLRRRRSSETHPHRPLDPTKIPCQTHSYIFGGQTPTTSIPR